MEKKHYETPSKVLGEAPRIFPLYALLYKVYTLLYYAGLWEATPWLGRG